MVYPQIEIKEKRKSFSMKVKILREDVEGEVFTSEEVTELKRTILEEIAQELDSLIVLMVEDEELSDEQILGLEQALEKVVISVENEGMGEMEEMEETQETEEEA